MIYEMDLLVLLEDTLTRVTEAVGFVVATWPGVPACEYLDSNTTWQILV